MGSSQSRLYHYGGNRRNGKRKSQRSSVYSVQQVYEAQPVAQDTTYQIENRRHTMPASTESAGAATVSDASKETSKPPDTKPYCDEQQDLQPRPTARRKKTRYSTPRSSSPNRHTSWPERPPSVISSSTTSDYQSHLSSTTPVSLWSTGLFSQVDPASSSTITAATDLSSTLSKHSLSWPADDRGKLMSAVAQPPASQSRAPVSTNDLSRQLQQANQADVWTIILQATQSALDQGMRTSVFEIISAWTNQTNNSSGHVWVAQCMMEGWGVAANPSLGFSRLQALAESGCWEAYIPLAEANLDGADLGRLDTSSSSSSESTRLSLTPNKAVACRWFKSAAEIDSSIVQQYPHAKEVASFGQYKYGKMLLEGEGIDQDEQQAFHWIETSANNGNKYGQYISGLIYSNDIIVAKDLNKAKSYFSSSAEQDFPLAQVALAKMLIDEQCFERARQWLERAEKQNSAEAMLELGCLYELGIGVPVQPERALSYYKCAAIQADNAIAQYCVGINYRLGSLGLPVDEREAARYLLRSARAGYAPAQRQIGLMYAQGLVGPKDEKTAFLWFRRAAMQGDVRALGLVGHCHEHGRGTAANVHHALENYHKAARIPSPYQGAAQWLLGGLLYRIGRHRDAFEWFVRASNSTTPEPEPPLECNVPRMAKRILARYYLLGYAGVPKNQKLALEMLTALTTDCKEDGVSHYWLAACYEEGVPGLCEPNLQKAFEHYMISAETGYRDAEFQVGLMLSNGQGVTRDRVAAFDWYSRAAQKGHKTALYSLGLYYAKGIGNTARDLERARVCFEKAARKGVTMAMTSLATLYRTGMVDSSNGIRGLQAQMQTESQDKERMVFWYQKAASLGDATAQRELGMLYDAGIGVNQSYEEAFRLLDQAAKQNDARATLLLGSYYQNGFAVEKNINTALELYLKAARLGAPVAPFAAAQVYHSLNQFEAAFAQYMIVTRDSSLAQTRIGKTSRLMVARYILSYVPLTTSGQSEGHMILLNDESITKQDAFQMLCHLATKEKFESSYFWLADCYRQGNGVEVDYPSAFYWYCKAVDASNDPEAMFMVGRMYEEGKGVDQDMGRAFEYFQRSAEANHPESQHKLGMAYWRGACDRPINLGMAVIWFTKAAAQQYAESDWALGQMALENGDLDVAVAWWGKSIALGHVPSMRALASLLLRTSNSPEDDGQGNLDRAMELLAEVVRSGDDESLVLLGKLHQSRAIAFAPSPRQPRSHHSSQGEGDDDGDDDAEIQEAEVLLQRFHEEQKLAIRCFEQAASMGNLEAMFLAGQCWHDQKQFAAALEHFERAAKQGHVMSAVMRARYLIAGWVQCTGDPEKGYQELLDCAQNKNCADAYISLGHCHEFGLGTRKDDCAALEWYLMSAQKVQDPDAMFRIGQMYARERVPLMNATTHKDMEALKWYTLACETGDHPRAHYCAGLYHLHGIHGTNGERLLVSNLNLATMHFRKAAEQNDPDAMYELAQLLLNDQDQNGHPFSLEDQVEGVAWLDRAAQLESRDAQRDLGKLYHNGKTCVVVQNFEKAYDYFCRAAQHGDRTATLFVGIYHEHGIHVAPNLEVAKEWYEIAVKLGKDEIGGWWLAELALARLLHQEEHTRAKAYEVFKEAELHAPDHQKSVASIMIARYKLHGWGQVKVSPTEAFQSLLQLAESGESKAIAEVARCYANGIGVDRNPVGAFQWYNQLLDHHYRRLQTPLSDSDSSHGSEDMNEEDEMHLQEACLYLAQCYENGQVVSPDPEKAITLYTIAAEKGSESAEQHLHSLNLRTHQ